MSFGDVIDVCASWQAFLPVTFLFPKPPFRRFSAKCREKSRIKGILRAGRLQISFSTNRGNSRLGWQGNHSSDCREPLTIAANIDAISDLLHQRAEVEAEIGGMSDPASRTELIGSYVVRSISSNLLIQPRFAVVIQP